MADAAFVTVLVDACLCREIAERTQKIRALERVLKEICDSFVVEDGEGGLVCLYCFASGHFFEINHAANCPASIANAALKKG